MKRYARALFAFPILAALLAAVVPSPAAAEVGVNLNINLGPPPILVGPPADLVLIPGTSVYFVPGIEADIFFCDGSWWAPRGPRWFRADSPRGPWLAVRPGIVPRPLFRVPRDYRTVYGREERIPYGRWEREHGGHRGERKHGHRDD